MNTDSIQKNPLLGAHTSIGGGLHNALVTGKKIGCEVVQVFSKNQMQWTARPLKSEEISKFLSTVGETGILPVAVHDSYLINLGSPKTEVFEKSKTAFIDELGRCESLQIPYLVMHPGSHLGSGETEGLNRIADGIKNCFEKSAVKKTAVLLETTAGQGTNLGFQFEQLKYLIDRCELAENIGICLDTCHIFASGYHLRTEDSWKKTRDQFDEIIGLKYLKLFHLNDSKKELNSRVDRHERIDKGKIGLEGFKALMNDSQIKHIPMVLEIPGGEKAYQQDLALLRGLVENK